MNKLILVCLSVGLVTTLGACGGDDGTTPNDDNNNNKGALTFEQAAYVGYDWWAVSVALDGTTIVAGPQDENGFMQAQSPGGPATAVDIPRRNASISADGKHFVAVRYDTTSSTLEIWSRSSGTNWVLLEEVYTFHHARRATPLTSPRFSKDGVTIVADTGGCYDDPTVVMRSWHRVSGSWVGPDTLRYVDGSPLRGFMNPCFSDDGTYLFAATAIPGGYRIHQFKKEQSGAWQPQGPLGPQVNISDIEEIYCPFFSFDGSYLYFGAYDHDHLKQDGIYRAKAIYTQ